MIIDAYFHEPTEAMIEDMARRAQRTIEQARTDMEVMRVESLAEMKRDSFRCGFQPDIWVICRAMLDVPWCRTDVTARIAERWGWDEAVAWKKFKDRLMERHGYKQFVRYLLGIGANRSGKSRCAASLSNEACMYDPGSIIRLLCENEKKSKEEQQSDVWNTMPVEWRHSSNTNGAYIVHNSDATGFGNNRFITENGSNVRFSFYGQKLDNVMESGGVKWMFPDEKMPVDWAKAAFYRLADRNGRMLLTFTPTKGYTPTVKLWQEGMQVNRMSVAWMLPRDGGEPLPWREIGVTREEYHEIMLAHKERRGAKAPQSRPEDCLGWADTDGVKAGAPIDMGPGRKPRLFEAVPRMAACADPNKGIVWFHCGDNPWGNPALVMRDARQIGIDDLKTRVYGLALKQWSAKFPRFRESVHCVDGADWLRKETA